MSGIQFSSPVTNQKASPAVYASSLATRPSPQLPGRIFVDTDNPSTGMYRDTGSAWVQIASAGGGGSQDLQSVCNNGYSTDTDMEFLYENSLNESKISFYNQDVGDFTFEINKQPNEIFSIRALKPSGANEEFGIEWNGADNVIRTIYNDQGSGLFLDFVYPYFILGSYENGFDYYNYIRFNRYDGNSGVMYFENSGLIDSDPMQTFKHYFQSNWEEGLSIGTLSTTDNKNVYLLLTQAGFGKITVADTLSGANGNIYADFNQSYFNVNDGVHTGEARITNNSGIRTFEVSFDYNSSSFGLDATNTTLTASNNLTSNSAGGNSGKHLKIKINGVQYKITLNNN